MVAYYEIQVRRESKNAAELKFIYTALEDIFGEQEIDEDDHEH